jgi:hypothetical protein
MEVGIQKEQGSKRIVSSQLRKAPLLLGNSPRPPPTNINGSICSFTTGEDDADDGPEPSLMKYDEMISKFVFTMLPATSSTCGVEDIRTEELATDFINSNLPTRRDRAEFYSSTIRKVYQVQRMQDMNKIMQVNDDHHDRLNIDR